MKTDEGWLIMYHGKGDNSVYSLFCLLLDLEEPYRAIRRGSTPLLYPTEPYETGGFFPNVVFLNGVVEMEGELSIYYGASDHSVGVAMADTELLLGAF